MGLPLAVAFAEAGRDVVAVDVNHLVIDGLRAGRSHIQDVSDESLGRVRNRIEATSDSSALERCEAVLICVPTPLTVNREPDLSALVAASRALAGVLREGQLVVLESTTFPGTTREHLALLPAESGLAAGEDYNLAYSPERVDPGRTDFTLRSTPKASAA